MARIELAVCDKDQSQDEVRSWVIGQEQMVLVDLCAKCSAPLLELQALGNPVAVQVAKARKPRRPRPAHVIQAIDPSLLRQ